MAISTEALPRLATYRRVALEAVKFKKRPLPPGSHSPMPGAELWLVAQEWISSPARSLEGTFVEHTLHQCM